MLWILTRHRRKALGLYVRATRPFIHYGRYFQILSKNDEWYLFNEHNFTVLNYFQCLFEGIIIVGMCVFKSTNFGPVQTEFFNGFLWYRLQALNMSWVESVLYCIILSTIKINHVCTGPKVSISSYLYWVYTALWNTLIIAAKFDFLEIFG